MANRHFDDYDEKEWEEDHSKERRSKQRRDAQKKRQHGDEDSETVQRPPRHH